jgi:DUF4097 and DUF4098 domain-containing protein YvlB
MSHQPTSDQPFSARQEGNLVELVVNEESHDWFDWATRGIYRAEVDVRVPKSADLRVETSNGAIEVSSLSGTVSLRTSNGAVNLIGLKGHVKVRTSNGGITAEDVDGDCDVSTSNGRIDVAGRFDALDLHSSNGSVAARAASGSTLGSRWDIGTSNAPVELAVPSTLKADLDVTTSNGGVQLDIPVTVQGFQDRSQVHGALNGGGPVLSVHTSNGHIHLSGV